MEEKLATGMMHKQHFGCCAFPPQQVVKGYLTLEKGRCKANPSINRASSRVARAKSA
jgi:hypothetical protein